MKRLSIKAVLIFVAALVFLAIPAVASAATWRTGDTVSITEDTTINDDLYIGSGTAIIDGVINGNLFVGGGNVTINGDVEGNLFIGGGTVILNGTVDNSALLTGGQLSITGEIGEDVLVAGGTLDLNKESGIGRDLIAGCGVLNLNGRVGRNVWVAAGNLTVAGMVRGNIRAEVDKLSLADSARVAGTINYWGPNKAAVDSEADLANAPVFHKVSGEARDVSKRDAGFPTVGAILMSVFWWFVWLFARLIFGAALIILVPRVVTFTNDTLRTKPWACLGVGVLVLMVAPVFAFIAALTLVGLPFTILTLHLFIWSIFISMIVTGTFLGRWLLSLVMKKEPNLIGSMILGVILLAVVTAIPFLGWLISMVSVSFGVGALAMGLAALVKTARLKPAA